MSYNNSNVPVIAITPDDDLNDFDVTNNIDEVATDVEDIYFQSEKRKKKSKRQNIKRDAYATDVEDMEGSDDDIVAPIVKHSTPLSLNDIMLAEETPIVDESYKSNERRSKTKPKLKSQTSVSANKHFLELDDMDSYQVLTDYEDFDASDEDDEASDIETSDTDLLKEIIHDSGSIAISDSVKKFLQAVPSPMVTPDFSENESQKKSNSKSLRTKKPCRHFISPSSISPHLSDITDTEMIHYDSNDEMKGCKQKHKYGSKGRRHTVPHKYKPDTTDSDRDESENELTKLRRVTVADLGEIGKLKLESSGTVGNYKNNPLTIHEIESDEEENAALYPVKKNTIKKSSNVLKVIQNPDEGITDTEDIGDFVPEEIYAYDESSINLNDYENSGGIIEEKTSIKLSKNLNKLAETRIYKSLQHDSNEASTDEEEEIVAGEKEDDKVEITEDINIKFIRNKKATTPKKNKLKEKPLVHNLCLPENKNDEALTDVENLNSSDDESQNENEIPITVADNESIDNETDSESVEGELQKSVENEIDEKYIPPVSRKIICETETEDNKLNIISKNINDKDLESDIVNNKTDIEDFSGDEIEEESVPVQIEGAFEFGDVEKVSHKDALKVPNCDDNDEGETDVEDIDNLQKPTRSKRSKRFLYVNNDDTDKLTDVEDIILNDKDNTGNYLGVDPVENTSKTDVEDFDASDNEQEQPVPEYCRTPDIMRQMGGETVCSQEGSGHFTKQDIKKLNEKHRSFSIPEVSVSPTLTDEFMASADDEVYTRMETVTPSQMTQALDEASYQNIYSQSSKKMNLETDEEVMYLKGGGFLPDVITDTEEMGISDEEYFLANEKQNEATNKVWLNIKCDQNQHVLNFDAAKQNMFSVSCLQGNVFEQGSSGMSVLDTAVSYSLENKSQQNVDSDKPKMLMNLAIRCSKLGYKTKITINHVPTYFYSNIVTMYINYPKEIKLENKIYSSKFYIYVEKDESHVKEKAVRSKSLNNVHMTKSSFGTEKVPYYMKFRRGSVTKLVAKYEPNIKPKCKNKKTAPQIISTVSKSKKGTKDAKKNSLANIGAFLHEIKQVNRKSSSGTQKVIEKAKHFETLIMNVNHSKMVSKTEEKYKRSGRLNRNKIGSNWWRWWWFN